MSRHWTQLAVLSQHCAWPRRSTRAGRGRGPDV